MSKTGIDHYLPRSSKEKCITSQHLRIKYNHNYEHDIPTPAIVGFFSIDKNRQFLPTSENLKYLCKYDGRVEFDLNDGYDSFVPKDEKRLNDAKLEFVLQWIIRNDYLNKLLNKEVFVCLRGLLATVMQTPYEKLNGWIICAEKVKEAIFLYAFDTEEKKREIEKKNDYEKLLSYYGFKFEQYLLSDEPGKEPNTSLAVNSNEEFNITYENKLNNHKIFYAAEVDGINSALPVDLKLELDQHKKITNQFIELKTSFQLTEKNSHSFRRFKSLKWWTQSYLVGIEKITCGFRNQEGVVRELRDYDTNSLPYQAQGFWNTRVCMAFLDDFLTFVRDKLRREKDFTRWIFRWNASEPFVSAEEGRKNDEFDVLPEWFTKKCEFLSMGS